MSTKSKSEKTYEQKNEQTEKNFTCPVKVPRLVIKQLSKLVDINQGIEATIAGKNLLIGHLKKGLNQRISFGCKCSLIEKLLTIIVICLNDFD